MATPRQGLDLGAPIWETGATLLWGTLSLRVLPRAGGARTGNVEGLPVVAGGSGPWVSGGGKPTPTPLWPLCSLAGACTMAAPPLPSPPRGQPRLRDRRACLQERAGRRAWTGCGPTVGRQETLAGGTKNVIWTARCLPGTGRCLLQSSQHNLDHPHFTDTRLREVNGPA